MNEEGRWMKKCDDESKQPAREEQEKDRDAR